MPHSTTNTSDQNDYSRFLEARKRHAEWGAKTCLLPIEQRIEAVVQEVVGGGEMSYGEALRLAFPEAKSGDVAPGADFLAVEGLRALTEHWVSANVQG